MIETPYFKNLRKWREEHGFVTEEWRAYVRASQLQNFVVYAIGVALGVLFGWGLHIISLNP